jgi:hypothetical protein
VEAAISQLWNGALLRRKERSTNSHESDTKFAGFVRAISCFLVDRYLSAFIGIDFGGLFGILLGISQNKAATSRRTANSHSLVNTLPCAIVFTRGKFSK